MDLSNLPIDLTGLTEANRPIRLRLTTERGVVDDLLLVKQVSGGEAICGGIEYALLCVSTRAGMQLKQFIANPVELQFLTDTGGLCWRQHLRHRIHLNGFVGRCKFSLLPRHRRLHHADSRGRPTYRERRRVVQAARYELVVSMARLSSIFAWPGSMPPASNSRAASRRLRAFAK